MSVGVDSLEGSERLGLGREDDLMATQQEAKEALFDAVVSAAQFADQLGSPDNRAKVLTAAAIAYRAAAGGAQVGGVFIDK